MIGCVDVEHAHLDYIPFAHNISGMHKAPLGKLRNVDQAFKPLLQADEGTKAHHVGDSSLNQLANRVAFSNQCPRIRAQPFQAEGYAAFVGIHSYHLNLDILTGAQYISRMADSFPGDLRNMKKTLDTTEVHKSPKGGQVGHHTLADVAWLECVKDSSGQSRVLRDGLLRKDQLALLRIYLDETQR
jgi:hypothetical protein